MAAKSKANDAAEIAAVINRLDRNNDGIVEALEIYHVVKEFADKDAAKEAANRILKFTTIMFAVLLTISVVVNCVFLFVVVDSFTIVSVSGTAMISRESGAALHVDPASFSVMPHEVPSEEEEQVSCSKKDGTCCIQHSRPHESLLLNNPSTV